MNGRLSKMNSQQVELYKRIQAFSFDRPDRLPFSKRLARDNGWSLAYARRVIDEYKKFAFLAVAASHPVTPSDGVDQVWHLHLSYTRSYWQFCQEILQTPLDHEPTRGGSSERTKFNDWYSQTLESYEHFFGTTPPIDIWSSPKIRFGRDLHFVRVNIKQNWVIPKPDFQAWFELKYRPIKLLPLLFILTLSVTSCTALGLPNPIDFTGSQFLTFYIPLGIIGIVLAYWLHFKLRLPEASDDGIAERLNTYEIAFLKGGTERAIGTAIVNLVQQGYVEVVTKKLLVIENRKLVLNKTVDPTSPSIEQLVAQNIVVANGKIKQIFARSTNVGDEIKARLQQLGLVLSNQQSFKAKLYPLLIILFIIGIGITKTYVGISRGKPVEYLWLCIGILIFSAISLILSSYRSRCGDRVLERLIDSSRHLEVECNNSQLALAFALFGRQVLAPNSELRDLDRILAFNSDSNNSAGGGDGDGGCGGCGGCGGGGN